MKILGTSNVSLQAAQAWAKARGSHQRFYDVAPHYWSIAPRYGIPPEILYAQAAHETNKGKYTGVVPWTHHNWAGIKTKDGWSNIDPAHHQVFPDDATGVLAHIQHLARYAGADDTGSDPLVDPRWSLVTKFTDSVEGLGGAWAPASSYGTGLLPIITDIRKFANDGSWDVAGDDDRFEWLPELAGEFGYPQGTHGRNGFSIDLGVLHITIGNDSLAYLRGGNGNSAHYLTDKAMRPRAQMVREADAAWTGGHRDYNLRGIHIEGEKRNVADPWTDEMYVNLAGTCYGISKRNNIPLEYLGKDNGPGKRGWIGHSDIPDPDGSGWGGAGNHTDPGDNFDWPRFIAAMRRLDGGVPPLPIPDGPPAMPETVPDPWRADNPYSKDIWIPKAFVANIQTHGFMATGYALYPAFAEGSMVVQYFERARMELHADLSVHRGLVGLEVFAGRYPDRVN